jgi:hypothetical protein
MKRVLLRQSQRVGLVRTIGARLRIHRAVCPATLAWASVPERPRLDPAVASSSLPRVFGGCSARRYQVR